jgi:hypothetical protein
MRGVRRRAGRAQACHDGDELRGGAPPARGNQQSRRAASAFSGEAHPAGEAAPGASEFLAGAVPPGRVLS